MSQPPLTEPAPPAADVVPLQGSWIGWYRGVGVVLAILLAAPIWLVNYPPLVDYPNHLARGYILYHYHEVPSFAKHFEIDYLSTPTLAMDLFMVVLQPIFDIHTVGKLFLTLILWLWLAGWHLLGVAVHGRPTWLAWGAALIAYHSMFLYGFTNFSFSLGMFLCAAAAWITWRATWSWQRFVLMMLLTIGCYGSHIAAYVFLLGTALAVTSWDVLMNKQFSRNTLSGFVPMLLTGGLLVFARRSGTSIIEWNTLQGKLVGALTLFRGYDRTLDLAFLIAVLIFLTSFCATASRIRAQGAVLFAGLGCLGMFLLAPRELFGGAPADARFLPPAAALTTLSLEATIPRKRGWLLLGTFLALVLLRLGVIVSFWQTFDADLRAQTAMFDRFAEGARVYPIVRIPDQPEAQKLALPSFHAIGYGVPTRHIYIPTLLAYVGQQPLRYKTPPIVFHDDAVRFASWDEVPWERVFANYDYLWCKDVPADYLARLEQRSTVIDSGSSGVILQIRKTSKR
jgi:hypothetical protein